MSKLAKILKARANAWAAQRHEEMARGDLHDDLLHSGIHPAAAALAGAKAGRAEAHSPLDEAVNVEPIVHQVTLIVYGWHNVQPGPLSWVFPSVRQALVAAKAMRNAVCWAIVKGRQTAPALEDARRRGIVLLEHAG
jgi:hypothetical protein